ncbi:DUF7275 domain-containing protein [Streptosporangium sp. OZ121]|uniref:DUF7275 domain-containing protein n=1 Tax=Streptosporangium sp. OZ121 TaxID=3444183 RepID=UPI003F78F847
MTVLIVGSTALTLWYGNTARPPKDVDVFSPKDVGDTDRFWDDAFNVWFAGKPEMSYATPDELITIKASHAYWDLRNNSWNKHMNDLLFLKERGAKILPDLHDMLYEVWERRYGKKQVNLTQEADDFFNDAVTRVYDHDSIHDSVAYGDRPLYESVLKDGASVQIDMAKVRALPFEDQVRLFREEIYATALERQVIPSGYTCSRRLAYAWALRRTITSLTKGWSSRLIVANYDVFFRPDTDYVARHLSRADRLIPLEGK